MEAHESVLEVAPEVKERVLAINSAGALPQQQELLDALAKVLGPVLAGGPAAPVISALLNSVDSLQAAKSSGGAVPPGGPVEPLNAAPTIPIPATLATIVSPLPHRFKWMATMLAPLLMGGGAAVPLWQTISGAKYTADQVTQKVEAQVKTQTERAKTVAKAQVATDSERIKAESEARTKTEVDRAKTEAAALEKAHSEAATERFNKKMQESKLAMTKQSAEQTKALGVELAAKQASIDTLQERLQTVTAQHNQRNKQNETELQTRQNVIAGLQQQLTDVKKAPRSGILIWTGDSSKKNTIDLNGSKANTGRLEGALPGVPCRLEPGDPNQVMIVTPPGQGKDHDWKRMTFQLRNTSKNTTVRLFWFAL